jgi:two-component system sensor histidine kinase UhpB
MRKEAIEILLIEDNPADLLLIGEMLSDSRYVDFGLTHAALLSEGLGKVSDRRFDAILVDLSLPDSRGFGTFESLREMAGDVPIIVLTGVDDEELGARTLQEGAQDYLLKSELSTSLLVRSIRYAIERHRAEIALRLRERQLADAQRMSRTGSWEWDADSESFSCSDELYRILGRDPHSIRSPDEFLMERSLAALAEPASKPFCAEERIVLPDGSVRFLLSRAEIITDRRGRVTRMLGTCQDITERKEAEEALRQSETRFRALIEKSSDGISILSPDGRFIYSSPASIKILGYSPEELVGRDAFHGVHPDDLERTRALYARLGAVGDY